MKTKAKRVGSFLCFSSPDTDDNEKKHEKKQRLVKESSEVDRSDKKNRRRLMSKIVKSISFKSNSSKRGGKLQKEPNRSQTREASGSPANKSHSESFGKNSDETSSSSSSSPTSCSSSSSSPSSSSSSASSASCPSCAASAWRGKKTFMPPPAPRNYGYATGLFLVLLSLFVVVLCGRLCAILWTATWLYIVPRWRMSGRPPEFAKSAAAGKMRRKGDFREEEKKRIVMEGFLRRNRNLK